MDFRVVWTEPALRDPEEVVRFIATEDAKAAVRIGDEIVDHVEILSSFPEIGPACPTYPFPAKSRKS
jgi:plasmid stabilization system protein ParE